MCSTLGYFAKLMDTDPNEVHFDEAEGNLLTFFYSLNLR